MALFTNKSATVPGGASASTLTGFTATRIPFGSSAGALEDSADLIFDNSTNDLSLSVSESGGNVGFTLANASNTASSTAQALIQVAGSSGGDPSLRLGVSGVTTWDMKCANGTSDEFQLVSSSATVARALVSGEIGYGTAPVSGNRATWGETSANVFTQVVTTGTSNLAQQQVQAGGTRQLNFEVRGSAFASTAFGGAETAADLGSIHGVNVATLAFRLASATGNFSFITNDTRRLHLNNLRILCGTRFSRIKGTDIASAGTITAGSANVFDITGTTAIDYLTTTDWANGSMVTFQFDASVTVNHNTGSVPANTKPFLLAGAANFSATAGDTLTVYLHEDGWREMCRTVI